MKIELTTPLTKEKAAELKAGDIVSLTGTIYTGRDAAHKRMVEGFEKTGKFPFDLKDQIIYYVGPAPAKPGQVTGSAGPTTSGRMDAYAPTVLDNGSTGMIGKGARSKEVVDAMKKYGAVYIGAVGGAGALISQCVKKCEVVDFPGIVIIDSQGNNLYETEPPKYKK